MIDSIDISAVDVGYFETIEIKEYTIVIRSLSTGHYWCLLEQIYNGWTVCFSVLRVYPEPRRLLSGKRTQKRRAPDAPAGREE